MEADTTAEDIKNALTIATGKWEEDNKISELRPLGNDTLAATVTLKTEHADLIVEDGFLQVGLVKCRVEKRLTVMKCQRCWSHDHYTDHCTGPDRSNCCYKCGRSDHVAKECKNENACPLCNETGHKMPRMRNNNDEAAELIEKPETGIKEKLVHHEIHKEGDVPLDDSINTKFDKLINETRATVSSMDNMDTSLETHTKDQTNPQTTTQTERPKREHGLTRRDSLLHSLPPGRRGSDISDENEKFNTPTAVIDKTSLERMLSWERDDTAVSLKLNAGPDGYLKSLLDNSPEITLVTISSEDEDTNKSNKRGREKDTPEQVKKKKPDKEKKTDKSLWVISAWIKELYYAAQRVKVETKDISEVPCANKMDSATQTDISVTKEIDTQTEILVTREIGTRADGEIINEDERRKAEEVEIRKTLAEDTGYEGLRKIIELEWPDNAYRKTKIVRMNHSELDNAENVVVVEKKGCEKPNKWRERLAIRFPGYEELIKGNDGQVDYMVQTTRTSRKEQNVEVTNAVYLAPWEDRENNEIGYHLIRDLRENMKERNVMNATVVVMEMGEQLRKILEYVFSDVEIRFSIMGEPDEKEREGGPKKEKIHVKSEGKTYAELLKDIKEKVNVKQKGVEVASIRKTAKGDIIFEVSKGNAKWLQEEIQNKVSGTEARTLQEEKIVHISDIDGATTDEDLIEAIMTVTGTNDREVVKIRSMRTNRNGGQAAIVAARKDIAEKLLRAGRIRVGLINCRTREWVHLVRCFRCLQYGHQQSECKEEDNADACRKCGEKGHKEKGCEKESYCFTSRICSIHFNPKTLSFVNFTTVIFIFGHHRSDPLAIGFCV
ncbi:unnamed protein product [Psylliodes chrysocephalus]|uniref:CCHC-type domain-containing protein n=1 Tax=Psylliodes chrysocephalus TaxID=3402493 RepID=A0A9P0GF54_9CUCU|nr:unnamed protein product [Psylliodes chrysocephala]